MMAIKALQINKVKQLKKLNKISNSLKLYLFNRFIAQPNLGLSQAIEIGQNKNTLVIFSKEMKGDQEKNYQWTSLKAFDLYETVNDVSWANLNGRSFHLLASADKTGVKIWKFILKDNSIQIIEKILVGQDNQNYLYILSEQQDSAWRVSWNILATIIAASYNSQEIRIYKNINQKWICSANLTEQQSKIDLKNEG